MNAFIKPLLKPAAKLILEHKKASGAVLQRNLVIPYFRAAQILDQLARLDVIGDSSGARPREIYPEKLQKILDS